MPHHEYNLKFAVYIMITACLSALYIREIQTKE
jgi:hypothetical protein